MIGIKKTKRKTPKKIEQKKVKRKKDIANLYDFSIDGSIVRTGKKYVTVYEVEAFNIDILPAHEKDKIRDLFRNLYNSLTRPFEIRTVQVAKNYDEIKNNLLLGADESQSENTKILFIENFQYLNSSIGKDIINVKYYLKFEFKNKQELENIDSNVKTTFKNECKVERLNNEQLKILQNQLINWDYYDSDKMSFLTELEKIGGDLFV